MRTRRAPLWLKVAAAGLAAALVAGVGFVGVKLFTLRSSIVSAPLNLGTDHTALPVDRGTDPLQILLLGTDSRANTGGRYGGDPSSTGSGNSDVMMLMQLSADRERVTVVSLPRDLLTTIPACTDPATGEVYPEQQFSQLNMALSYGGPGCTVAAVNELTGLEVDHFMMADFNAVKELTTVIGGVDVCVNEPINDTYSKLVLPAGVSTVQGEQALAFLRTRHAFGDGGDRGRVRAQQSFLASMARKLTSEGTLTNVPRLYAIAEAVARNLTVDEGLAQIPSLLALADRVKSVDLGKVAFVSLPTTLYEPDPNRLVMKDEEGQRLFQILREDGDVTAESGGGKGTAGGRPAATSEADGDEDGSTGGEAGGAVDEAAGPGTADAGTASGTADDAEEPAFDAAAQPVQVLNESGTGERAQDVAAHLRSLGYDQAVPAPAEGTSPATQILYAEGFEEVARALAAQLGVPEPSVLSGGTQDGVAVVVGQDFTSGTKLADTSGLAGGLSGQTADQVTCQQSGGF
ncbi:LCP family protein [Arthrobacter sp. E918]|uniref:LCP family protein n=2 Tax=Arthrobacter mobilis TaxID=2724944 RepID=A0A7X6K5N1_9MICC|nr:LCP family protein [Arthrobacter mobilis]